MTVTILWKDGKPYPITKINAYCLLVLLPARIQKTRAGIIVREVGQHWERVTSDNRVVRCHTHYEAEEARQVLLNYVPEQWLDVTIESYMPTNYDVPYHEWIRGMRDERVARLGMRPQDLPEEQDPGLLKMSDDDWITNGPR